MQPKVRTPQTSAYSQGSDCSTARGKPLTVTQGGVHNPVSALRPGLPQASLVGDVVRTDWPDYGVL
eukprot:497602-Alexandrium_andersonii.AAC.1